MQAVADVKALLPKSSKFNSNGVVRLRLSGFYANH